MAALIDFIGWTTCCKHSSTVPCPAFHFSRGVKEAIRKSMTDVAAWNDRMLSRAQTK